jgi:hypothetical protein
MKAIFDVVTEDYELIAIPLSAGIGNPNNFKIEETFSEKVKIDGKKILTNLSWDVNPGGCIMPGCTFSKKVEGEITASSTKCKVESSNVFLKLDMGKCSGTFVTNTPVPTTIPCTCNIIIKSSGQSKSKAKAL